MKLTEILHANPDIDTYLNRLIPRSRLDRLPRPLSWFLGHRAPGESEHPGNILVWIWSFIGAFCGIALIEAVSLSDAVRRGYDIPLVLGSFGAAAILEFNTIESPLAQPRNSVLGHFMSAVVGVSITKLFRLHDDFANLRWIAGALSCGVASAVMGMTKTVHPPAGATALLAAVDMNVVALGWYLLPLVMLSSVLMLIVALLINNIQRQFPTYWWTPANLARDRPGRTGDDIEKRPEGKGSLKSSLDDHADHDEGNDEHDTIAISGQHIIVPEWIYLADEERNVLEVLKDRLTEGRSKRWRSRSRSRPRPGGDSSSTG
ncbi:MAG: hypothetical protein M1817_006342 [Caeruleum heppii]|nr:MAG: hypothetical protein M1817_006342 [Caeruleum heppii]